MWKFAPYVVTKRGSELWVADYSSAGYFKQDIPEGSILCKPRTGGSVRFVKLSTVAAVDVEEVPNHKRNKVEYGSVPYAQMRALEIAEDAGVDVRFNPHPQLPEWIERHKADCEKYNL